jgi:hypothetical protein
MADFWVLLFMERTVGRSGDVTSFRCLFCFLWKCPNLRTNVTLFRVLKFNDNRKSYILESTHLSMLNFWVVTPCGLVSIHQPFGGKYCLHLRPWKLVSTHKFKRHYGQEDQHGHLPRFENLISRKERLTN